jgi:para-aminobenzoate synthetase/4-amino-4-deoxychorismate lyase
MTKATQPPVRIVLRDEACGKWLDFASPQQILTARSLDEVIPLLRQLEQGVERERLYAAGFISYEAAPAFDASLPVRVDKEFPLLWFGLFRHVNEISLSQCGGESETPIVWNPSVTEEAYRSRLDTIREFIRAGETYQVNFTYRLQAKTEADPWKLFLQIAGDGDTPCAAFVDNGEWAICSASPELFLRLEGNHLQSRPMKGTAARGLWSEDDLNKRETLLDSHKDRAENLMIVDMVRNDLGRVAQYGTVHVSSLFEAEKHPSVWQLTSTISARTYEPLHRILQATFPPASVTGAPKRQTMQIIAELESSPRRVYTGAIGFATPGRRAQFNVAIRTILLHKPTGRAEYGVGGGIVWDSKPADEYQECLTKTKALKPLPRDFDLYETMLWSPESGYSLLEYHLKRLIESAEYFGFQADSRMIQKTLADFAVSMPARLHRVRFFLSRRGNTRCEATPLEPASLSFGDVGLAKQPIDAGDVFLYHKTTRRKVYEDALRLCPGHKDVLLFNEAGQVTESTRANVAVEINGVLYTPPVRCGLLPGTCRASLLEQGRLQERTITVQEVLNGHFVYLLNSVRGMHKVQILEPMPHQDGMLLPAPGCTLTPLG